MIGFVSCTGPAGRWVAAGRELVRCIAAGLELLQNSVGSPFVEEEATRRLAVLGSLHCLHVNCRCLQKSVKQQYSNIKM